MSGGRSLVISWPENPYENGRRFALAFLAAAAVLGIYLLSPLAVAVLFVVVLAELILSVHREPRRPYNWQLDEAAARDWSPYDRIIDEREGEDGVA